MQTTASAGNKGKDIRSDCFVRISLKNDGGISIELNSKVEKLYGDSIVELSNNVLAFFGIENALVEIEDKGALPFVIAARLEATIKQLIVTEKEYLPDILPDNRYRTLKDNDRRSRLYLPGNTPKLILNAGVHAPDGIILDLEDSVAIDKKDEARILVRNALRSVDFYGTERMVRINQLPLGLIDIESIIKNDVDLILIPKCEDAQQVQLIDEHIQKILINPKHRVHLMPIIESALGVVNAYSIATASDNVVALAIGLEDYTADIGAQRTVEGDETFFARSQLVNAARAAKIQPIDSVFSDVADIEGLKSVVSRSKAMGFVGMGCIHPRQIKIIHDYYAPTESEVKKAIAIVNVT